MAKQTNYELLKDVYQAVQRLEDKMDKRMVKMEEEVEEICKWKDNLSGKIAIVVGFASLCATLTLDWVREKLFR